jgi:hypothetical protein
MRTMRALPDAHAGHAPLRVLGRSVFGRDESRRVNEGTGATEGGRRWQSAPLVCFLLRLRSANPNVPVEQSCQNVEVRKLTPTYACLLFNWFTEYHLNIRDTK